MLQIVGKFHENRCYDCEFPKKRKLQTHLGIGMDLSSGYIMELNMSWKKHLHVHLLRAALVRMKILKEIT